MPINIKIDFDIIEDVALRGMRRAYYFSGMTYNQENLEGLKQTPPGLGVQVFPPYPVEKLSELKNAFSHFNANNCLREIIESFSLFLDQLYRVLEMYHSYKTFDQKKIDERVKIFQNLDFPSKVREFNHKLAEKHKISSKDREFLIGLQRLRNCITHSGSVVGKNKRFLLTYPRFRMHGIKPNGQKIPIRSFPFKTPDVPIKLQISFDRERKFFKDGEVIYVDNEQMTCICFGALNVCKAIKISAMRTAEALGFYINNTNSRK